MMIFETTMNFLPVLIGNRLNYELIDHFLYYLDCGDQSNEHVGEYAHSAPHNGSNHFGDGFTMFTKTSDLRFYFDMVNKNLNSQISFDEWVETYIHSEDFFKIPENPSKYHEVFSVSSMGDQFVNMG